MRKWIPGFLILAGVVFGAAVYGNLPSRVVIHWETLVPWVPAASIEPIPRAVAAFGLPILAGAVWFLLVGVASPTGERLGRRVFPNWLVSETTGADGDLVVHGAAQ